jgi:soluble lytic murein transglycosylase-like protein
MSLITRPATMKMAPPGSHVVARQARISKNGIKYFVKAHIRKNRGKKVVLLPENLLYLYWLGDQEYPNLGKVKGYGDFPDDLDPFLIKVIIAIESRFRPSIRTKLPGSSATGLMQITNKTREDLNGKSKESKHALRDSFLDLDMVDLTDPVINMLRGYYDWHNGGEAYAHKVLNLYNASLVERLGNRP